MTPHLTYNPPPLIPAKTVNSFRRNPEPVRISSCLNRTLQLRVEHPARPSKLIQIERCKFPSDKRDEGFQRQCDIKENPNKHNDTKNRHNVILYIWEVVFALFYTGLLHEFVEENSSSGRPQRKCKRHEDQTRELLILGQLWEC